MVPCNLASRPRNTRSIVAEEVPSSDMMVVRSRGERGEVVEEDKNAGECFLCPSTSSYSRFLLPFTSTERITDSSVEPTPQATALSSPP